MSGSVKLSIHPTFYCNYGCPYCYLGNLREQKQVLALDVLSDRLKEIQKLYSISSTQILGGEVSTLDEKYLFDLCSMLKDIKHSITTNLSNTWLINFCLQNNIGMGVSLNKERPNYELTLKRLKVLKGMKNITVTSVVLPSLLEEELENILCLYEELGFTAYFIQYHPSIYSEVDYNISTKDFNHFLERLSHSHHKGGYTFKIGNEIASKDKSHKASYDNCLFINPNGNFSTILENDEGREYYKEFNSIEEFDQFRNSYWEERYSQCQSCSQFSKCQGQYVVSANPVKCSQLFSIFSEDR